MVKTKWAFVALPIASAGNDTAARWQSKPPEKIEIDGSKNPGMIPQWLIWQNTFDVVNHLAEPNPDDPLPPHERMGVPKKDWDVLLAEARHQAEQAAQVRKKLEPIIQKLKAQKKTLHEIFEATEPNEIELEGRWVYLAGEDRVMALLSPEGAIGLQKWIDRAIVRGLTMRPMDRSDYERFRKPR